MVSGGSVDVNLLLTQLLAKGLIGQADASPPASQALAAETGSADATAATDVSEVHTNLLYTHITLHCSSGQVSGKPALVQ